MKNRLYILFSLIILGAPEFVTAQLAPRPAPRPATTTSSSTTSSSSSSSTNNNSKKADIPTFTVLQNQSFAHWSYGICAGVSKFEGDFDYDAKKMIPSSNFALALGGNIERTFTPVFGMGIDYAYLPYRAEPANTMLRLEGISHEGSLYFSINLPNLFYQGRPQKWGVFFNFGMGVAYYNANMKDITVGDYVPDGYGNLMNLKDGFAWVWPLSLGFEYNASKNVALGIKAEYRIHSKDNFEGYTTNIQQGNNNDAFEILYFTLRHKPHIGKKNHVRNLSYGEVPKDIHKKLADMENALRNMKPGDKGDTCCASNAERIARLEKMLGQKVTEPSLVDEKTKRTFNIALRGIQFETAKSDIKAVSFPIMDDIVTIMKENPAYELDIIGHADIVGDDEMNQDLSERRAHSVRSYLMGKGVSGIRLYSWGKGRSQPVAPNDTEEGKALNRRVQFIVREGGKVLFKTD